MTTYRQLSRRLRVAMGPGHVDFVSERPMDSQRERFLDEPDGTTVEFPEGAQVDIPFLLRVGAIAELTPPEMKSAE